MKLILFFLISFNLFATENEYDFSDDFKTSLNYAYDGIGLQFSTGQGFLAALIATASTFYFVKNDDQISKKAVERESSGNILTIISDSAVFFNTPVLPSALWLQAKRTQDDKLRRFAMEFFATGILAMGETVVISAIPVHQRPSGDDLSPVETWFRGRSSFPSGHVIGFAALGFKTLQFYGPLYSIVPLGLAGVTAYERVHSEKHFASDVIASGFITLMASEGVRLASKYEHNHPLYKLIFDYDFRAGYIYDKDSRGVQVSWSY